MKKKVLCAICLVFMLTVIGIPAMAYGDTQQDNWTDHAATSFAGGDGTASDPYLIGTPEQLAKLSKDVVTEKEDYDGKYFKLTTDIDLSGHIWVPIGLYEWDDLDYGHFTGVSFRGSLDGDGHTITNMTVDQRTDQHSGGLFGNIQNAGSVNNEIKNLIVKDARIYSSTRNGLQLNVNGILSAVVSSDAEHTVKITNVDTSGIITRVENVSDYDINGGMLGQATRATVTNCHVRNIDIAGTDEKNGPNRTGGFVGMDNNSSYENCTAAGSVSGGATMGGFVGCATTSTNEDPDTASSFKHCMADVEVHASDWNSGGFAAYAEYTIFRNCVAKGDVTSTVTRKSPKVGGFTGNDIKVKASNCHAAGKLTSTHPEIKPGGFAGAKNYTSGTYINNSYDSEKNPGIKATNNNKSEMIDVEGIEGVSTQQVKANICRDYDGNHKVSEVEKKEATCTEDGNDTYYVCNACGTMYSDADMKNFIPEKPVIRATGHKLSEVEKKEATCTEDGNEAYYICDNCGTMFADADQKTVIKEVPVIRATGHKLSEVEKKEATCTEDGNEAYYICENCGTMFADADQKSVIKEVPVIRATGHSFGEWKVTKKPTEKAEGTETRICENCQYTETRSIAKLDPEPENSNSASTGDDSSIALAVILMIAAAIAGGIVIVRRKIND